MTAPSAVTFSPRLHVDDLLAAYWLRQVTIRLRREVLWNWHEFGVNASPGDQDTQPPPPHPIDYKAIEALVQSRDWVRKQQFFTHDQTAKYLTEQLHNKPPPAEDSSRQGSFDWAVKALTLDDTSSFVLALGLLISFDGASESVISACLNDSAKKHPTLSLAQKIWDRPAQILALADPSHPLHQFGLLRYSHESNSNNTTTTHEIDWENPIEVPALVARQLLFPATPLSNFLEEISAPEDHGTDDFSITDASRVLVARLASGVCKTLRLCPIRGERHSAHIEVVRGIAKMAKRKIVEFKGDPRLLEDIHYLNSLATLCWLKGMDLFLGKDVVYLLTRDAQRSSAKFIPLQSIPVTIYLGITEQAQLEGVPVGLLLPTVEVPKLVYRERVDYWKRMLGGQANNLTDIILEFSRRFRYEKESIIAISRGLMGLGRAITRKDFADACQAEMELDLGDLAQKVFPRFNEDELVLPPKQTVQFDEIVNAVKSLVTVHYDLGMAKVWNEGGIFILFSGPSGTGKTMAAEILSAKLDLPMYRIDLSQVVSKYIGETEKKLKELFDAGDAYDLILFFDEGDAIFGSRTEVKDAHDMYANQQVSYLLERMERFKGVAILATNRKKDIDEAFARRIRYAIDFPFPGEQERKKIWIQVIPHSVDCSDIDFDFLAKHFQLAGGNIRSIVFNACLQCVANNNKTPAENSGAPYKLNMEQIIVATRREYEKLNRTISLEEFEPYSAFLRRIGYE